jgi:hypothetical protein
MDRAFAALELLGSDVPLFKQMPEPSGWLIGVPRPVDDEKQKSEHPEHQTQERQGE